MQNYMKKLIPFLLLLCACNTQQRDIKRLDALSIQQQPEFKRLANLLDPCFPIQGKSDTVRITGKRDTLITPGTITITHVKDTVVKTITLAGKTITQYQTEQITDTITDSRALQAIQAQLTVKGDSLLIKGTQLTTATKNGSRWMWVALGEGLLIIIGGVVAVYKFFKV